MKASELLQLRRDELAFDDRVTWVNSLPVWDDEACLVAGGRWQLMGSHLGESAWQFVQAAIGPALASPISVMWWNDQLDRTLPEVLDVLDRAIILAKEAGD